MEPGTFTSAFLFAVVPAVILLAVVYWLDRYEKEPIRLLLIALVVGAIAAPVIAVLVQSILDVPTSMATQTIVPASRLNVTTPVVEEIVRGLGILLVFFMVRREVDDLLDGLIYGAVVGIGFALAANFIAILTTHPLGTSSPGTASLFSTSVSGLNHLFYGGVIGMIIALARRRSTGEVLAFAALGVAVAIGFHLLHDYLPSWVATDAGSASSNALRELLADLPNILGFIALAVISTWALGREALVVQRELSDEVATGVVTREEYNLLTSSLRRMGSMARSLIMTGDGGRQWWIRRKLYSLESELAFRKDQRKRGVIDPELVDEDEYRARIAETRARLGVAESMAR